MTRFTMLAAFVPSRAPGVAQPLVGRLGQATSILSPKAALLDPFTKSACVSFFDGIKVPATLLTGASLAALFSMTTEAKDTSYISKLRIVTLRIYHLCSLLGLIMSLTSLMTAQAATTMLLFEGNGLIVTKALDAQAFMESMHFELILTSWSFIMSILLLLCSTTFRMILDFDLFTKRRRAGGSMVITMMAGVMGSCLSCLNTTQKSWPNLWFMTREVAELFWDRIYIKRYPLQVASAVLVAIATLCSLTFFLPTTVNHEQIADHENFT